MIMPRAADRPTAMSPEELAAAMRDGLESRRFFRAPADLPMPVPPVSLPDGALLQRLLETGGLVGMPAPARPGAKGKAFRAVRKVLKKLLNPWLDQQTRFNHATFDHLQQLHLYLGRLAASADVQNEVTRRLVAELAESRKATATAHARLSEFFREVDQLRHALAAAGGPAADEAFPETPPLADPAHVVEGLFLHTRLAQPPARVLVLSPVGLHALDLAGLGYQVVQTGAVGDPLVHPGLRVMTHDVTSRLLPDGSFDAAVAMCGEGGQAHGAGLAGADPEPARRAVDRALAPGGRVVGSIPVTGAVPSADDVADQLAPFRVTDVCYAARAGHGWTLAENPVPSTELVLYVAVKD